MYTYVISNIRNLLRNEKYDITQKQILSKFETPDDETIFFVRVFFTYGDQSFSSNNITQASDLLILEVYERKYTSESRINDFVSMLRKDILSNFKVLKNKNKIGRISGLSVSENLNDEMWKSYTLTVPIYIYEEEND